MTSPVTTLIDYILFQLCLFYLALGICDIISNIIIVYKLLKYIVIVLHFFASHHTIYDVF